MDERMEQPGEIVSCYVAGAPREVVLTYVSELPLPAPVRAPQKRKRSKKGLFYFLGAIALFLVLALALWFFAPRPALPPYGAEPPHTENRAITMEKYPLGGDVRLNVQWEHGAELSAQEIYRQLNPAVVTVLVQLSDGVSVGTGVIFTSDGYVLTNHHVVAGGRDCSIVLSTGTVYQAKFVAGDADSDIAVLKAEAQKLPVATIGDSDALTVGDRVYAIGNPLGVELRGTLTDGIVSAINRDVRVEGRTMTLIQTNAALNNGNSGGPLINCYGQVVGINTIKMSSVSSSVEGLGFALPTSVISHMVNDLIAFGKLRPEPVLGISVSLVAELLPDGHSGVRVYEVTPGSGAQKAGIRVDDVIVQAGDIAIRSSADLLHARRPFGIGEDLPLRLYRDGKYLTATVTLTGNSNENA